MNIVIISQTEAAQRYETGLPISVSLNNEVPTNILDLSTKLRIQPRILLDMENTIFYKKDR